jgi:non-heme chloroperoxidase
MCKRAWFGFLLLAPPFLLLLAAQDQNGGVWHDPSPHTTRFVTVEPNVQLEVLDWGGSGRPLILLNGLGGTAHGFDDFAPKLTAIGHVYGITRRGYGASSFPNSGYEADKLGDDVLSIMESLEIRKPALVGASIAGEELSSVGSRYPDRISGLVYLDAAYAYAFDNGKGMTVSDLRKFLSTVPSMPSPQQSDLASFSALKSWSIRNLGITLPEAEVRQMFTVTADGRLGERRLGPSGAVLAGIQKYADIRVPILAIFAIPHDPGPWANSLTDATTRDALAAFDLSAEKQARAFEDALRSARVVKVPHAPHAIFISNEADVLREMRAFLASLH